jgi:hypothetical protein
MENHGWPQCAVREAAAGLAAVRQRPCLVLAAPTLGRHLVPEVRDALGERSLEAIDVILSSHGGDIHAAYLIARELHRRAGQVGVFVPLLAKSAATLIALAGNELVLGPLGELGPLDAQAEERRKADFPADTSCLVAFKGMEQLRHAILDFYDDGVARILKGSGMLPFDACSKSGELTGAVFGPIVSQIDATRVAESARGLELASEYACRLLRRYRKDLHDGVCPGAVHRLIHRYPSHGFVVDLEELSELGFPARAAEEDEGEAIEALATTLPGWPGDVTMVELVFADSAASRALEVA